MRMFIFLGSLLLITFASFSQSGEKSKVEVGIYKLGKLTVNDGKRDSILPGINLIKMYTPSHFAFASLWNNSYVTYGIASYTQENKKIAQHFFYMTGSLDTVKNFVIEISMTDTGYIQKLPDAIIGGKKLTIIEEYSTIPSKGVSELDGAWKLEKSLVVNGKDTLIEKVTQYKLFQSGHYLYVRHLTIDSVAKKNENGFGYGKFYLVGKTLNEENELSNYNGRENHNMVSTTSFDGKDRYTQTVLDALSKNRHIETYVRLK